MDSIQGGSLTLDLIDTPPVDSDPPAVDLGMVNAGVSNVTSNGASPKHVGFRGAFDLPPVHVEA